jgi:lysozyme
MSTRVLSLICSLFLTACTAFDFPDPTPEDFAIHGIDVSRYQGDIDWNRVRQAGTEFAWIKATEGGDYVDPEFMTNWLKAKAAGVPRGVDPDALPPVLDMEWNAHSKTCRERPPRESVIRDMRHFLEAVEAHYGKRPVIYSSVDFHRDRLVGAKHGYDFWLRSVASHPDRKYEKRTNWVFWQYTATGRVDGVAGNVDRNVFYGSRSQWRDWLKGKRER